MAVPAGGAIVWSAWDLLGGRLQVEIELNTLRYVSEVDILSITCLKFLLNFIFDRKIMTYKKI